jgi:long-subunit acyl-CoA synthetase (AMP-forming)
MTTQINIILTPRYLALQSDKLGIYGKNRVEWFVAMEAANANGFVTVALYDTFGAENLTYVVNHSELTTVIGSIDRIQNVRPKLRNMCIFIAPSLTALLRFVYSCCNSLTE